MNKRLLVLVALFAAVLFPATAASAQDDVRVHLIHGIPDTDVDVAAAGAVVIPGFSFGDTQDLSGFAGQTLEGVEVLLAGTDTVAIDVGDFDVPASGNFTAIAHLDADGTPTLSVFSNDVSTIAAGNGRLVVRHAAAAPNVDILANGNAAFTNVPNGAEGAVDLAAGTISASVVPAGETAPVVIGPADLQSLKAPPSLSMRLARSKPTTFRSSPKPSPDSAQCQTWSTPATAQSTAVRTHHSQPSSSASLHSVQLLPVVSS